MSQWLVIGVSGVTCGGKTTLAHSLLDYFKALRGAQLWSTPYAIGDVQLLSQDDYFLPVDDLRHKWNDKLNAINFELITALDMKQMLSDITWTMKGRYLAGDLMENYEYGNDMTLYTNFEHYAAQYQQQYQQQQQQHHHHHQQQQQQLQQQQQQHQHQQLLHQHHHSIHPYQHPPPQPQPSQLRHSTSNPTHIMRVNPQFAVPVRDKKVNILIIEGFLIFNHPDLVTLCNIKFHFHLPYEKCYERRRKRTYDPPDVTGYFEICVWPYYEKNFGEYRDRKDITFLNGDMSKDKIFKFVVQRIVNYFEERCDMTCPPPQKFLGMLGTVYNNNAVHQIPKVLPMDQQ